MEETETKISQKHWILLNAIKGDATAYIPGGLNATPFWIARASKSVIATADHAELIKAGYMKWILPDKNERVLTAVMTPAGIAAWESVPGGIGPIVGKCDGCGEVKDVCAYYDGRNERFLYECDDCDMEHKRNRARADAQGV